MLQCTVFAIDAKKVIQEKLLVSLAAAPWAGCKFLKGAKWLLLGKEDGQQGPALGPHSGLGREGKMQQCPRGNRGMLQGSAGCRHTGKLQ